MGEKSSPNGLVAFRARVHADRDLAGALSRIEPERFTEELVRVAAALGYEVAPSDVDAAIADARRAWALRWIR